MCERLCTLSGILIGSVIYGFMPTDVLAKHAGNDNLLSIPVAAVIGIPLYIRAEAVIPLSAGASLTEVILLRSIFKMPMIWAFLTVILSMAIGAGFIYALTPLGT